MKFLDHKTIYCFKISLMFDYRPLLSMRYCVSTKRDGLGEWSWLCSVGSTTVFHSLFRPKFLQYGVLPTHESKRRNIHEDRMLRAEKIQQAFVHDSGKSTWRVKLLSWRPVRVWKWRAWGSKWCKDVSR